ncbi:MAG TPA: winged helix-turn-helix domain-containing protein [Nitrososphaerales archaeon]|nr:winged helix-turn-helix domain-containing protein [Nitrososphaerales archaeon]
MEDEKSEMKEGEAIRINVISIDNMDNFESLFSCLSNRKSREVIRIISKGEIAAKLIADKIGLTVQNAIEHLNQIFLSGIIRSRTGTESSVNLRGRAPRSYTLCNDGFLFIPINFEQS